MFSVWQFQLLARCLSAGIAHCSPISTEIKYKPVFALFNLSSLFASLSLPMQKIRCCSSRFSQSSLRRVLCCVVVFNGLIIVNRRVMIREQDHLFKVVIVGNQGVGKSSLFIRFCDDAFLDNYLPTIGVDFRFKMLTVGNALCKLQIWDTAGQERFRTITSAYYRSSQVVLIVYDMTDPATFREVEDYWIQEARNNSDSDVLICLVGNKCDMPSQLEDSEVSQLSGSIGLPSYFVSAKTGEGVEKMFQEICERLIQTASMRRKNDQARLNQIQERKKGCCK